MDISGPCIHKPTFSYPATLPPSLPPSLPLSHPPSLSLPRSHPPPFLPQVPLSPIGHEQARQTGRQLKALVGDEPLYIYTSPYRR